MSQREAQQGHTDSQPISGTALLSNYQGLRSIDGVGGLDVAALGQVLMDESDGTASEARSVFERLLVAIDGDALARREALDRQAAEIETLRSTLAQGFAGAPQAPTPSTSGAQTSAAQQPNPNHTVPAQTSLNSSALTSPAGRPRGAEPPIFRGKDTDPFTRQESYTNWRSQVRVKLALDRQAFPTAADRILYAAQRLAGDAYTHVRHAVDAVAANYTSPTSLWPVGWSDYESLITALDPVYVTIDVASRSARQFEALLQGRLPFADFLSSFIRLADSCGRDERSKVEALRQKVNNRLQNAVVSLVERPRGDDFLAWVELFRRLTNNIDDRDFRVTSTHGHRQYASTTPPKTTEDEGDAMQLDRVEVNGKARGPLSSAERSRRRDASLCMYCGGSGHYAKVCPIGAAAGGTQAGKA